VEHVVIGMDPHKRSVTIEVMTGTEQVLAKHRFETTAAGFRALLSYAKQWPDRLWAVEGCNGIGRHVANRLVIAGETAVDVPPKLSARLRMFDTRQGRKTDPDDAHAIAMVAVRMNGLRLVVDDEQQALLRILADRRRALGEDHTRMISQLHQLLLELIPGGAKKDLSAAQARVLLAGIRPRDLVGKTRKRVALELVGDLEKIYQRSKALDKEIKQLVVDTGSTLMDLHGIGPSSAARLMIEVGDITRFPDRNHFASWNPPGTAPHPSTPHPGRTPATGSPGQGTARSTGLCTSWRSSNSATRPKAAPTSTGAKPPARPRWRPCAASNADSPTSSTAP